MFIEDPPPPPPGDTEELETKAVKVTKFNWDVTHVDQVYSGGIVPGKRWRCFQKERIDFMFEGNRKEYVLHVEYER